MVSFGFFVQFLMGYTTSSVLHSFNGLSSLRSFLRHDLFVSFSSTSSSSSKFHIHTSIVSSYKHVYLCNILRLRVPTTLLHSLYSYALPFSTFILFNQGLCFHFCVSYSPPYFVAHIFRYALDTKLRITKHTFFVHVFPPVLNLLSVKCG